MFPFADIIVHRRSCDEPQQLRVTAVTPRSICISVALAWAEHYIRSVIRRWQWQDAGQPLPFDRQSLTW